MPLPVAPLTVYAPNNDAFTAATATGGFVERMFKQTS
jgi:hypothetical protein